MFVIYGIGLMQISAVLGNILIPGDIKVIGLLEIHEKNGVMCSDTVKVSSVITAEAMKWYFQQLNKYGGQRFKIGFEVLETCRLTSKAAEIAMQVFDRSMNRSMSNEYITGIIGPESYSETAVTSTILSAADEGNRLTQVGFSTSATILADSSQYPNFVRVVPNDNLQIEVMMQTMRTLGWNRIALIHEDDIYNTGVADLLKVKASAASICISTVEKINAENGISFDQISTTVDRIIVTTGTRYPVNGMIFLGSSTTAQLLFTYMDNSVVADVPLVMLSEGIHMDQNVFKKKAGTFIAKAKGSLAFSPVYKEIKEFTNHLKDIFTNTTIFQMEVVTNTWLLDVFNKITGCNIPNCTTSPISNQKFQDEFGKPPLYAQYAVMAAHAVAKAISLLHAQYCPNATNICETFSTKYTPSDILTKLRGTNLKFGLDFPWQLTDFANDVQNLRIDQSGEITPELGQPFYQVYNFRQSEVSQDPSKFDLVLVGNYINNSLSLDLNRFRDYNSQGQETTWPSMRKGQCKEGRRCSECIPVNAIQEGPFFQEGDAYVIGTIPVFDSSGTTSCGDIRLYNGYQLNEALTFAIKKINTNLAVFPTLKIGLVVLNSCNNPVEIQRKILDMVKNGLLLGNGTRISLIGKVIGFVGDVTSTMSISVAETLTRLQQVQISFSSTSALLSDRIKYPYFARVVTSDIEQANAIINIVTQLASNYIQLIHSEGNYGEGMRDKLKEIGYTKQICITNILSVGANYNVASFRDSLRKFPKAKLVVIVLQSSIVYDFVSNLANNINKGEFMFIGSEAWAKNPLVIRSDTMQHLLGSYTLSLEMYQDSELKSYLQGVNVSSDNVNSWKHLYLELYGNCHYEFSFDKSKTNVCPQHMDLLPDSWTTTAYVAVKSLLIGAHEYFSKVCGNSSTSLCPAFTGNPKDLYAEILKVRTDIDGSGDQLKVFNDNGDGTVGYRIYNIQTDTYNPQNLLYSEVGRYSQQGLFTFKQPVLDDDFNSVCPNQRECDACFNATPTVPADTFKSQINVGMVIALVFLAAAVVVIVILGILVWQVRKQRRKESIYLTPTQKNTEDGENPSCERTAAVGSEVPSEIIPRCSKLPSDEL